MLARKNCVCAGIAFTIKYLCDRAGIPCTVVFGGVHDGEDNEDEP